MNPYDEGQGYAFQQDVLAAYQEAGQPPDVKNVVWTARMTYDAVTIGYPASRVKHLRELRAALGLEHGARADIRANFCGARDRHGRAIFDVYYISLSDEDRADWRAVKQAAGLTHWVLCPVAHYPGYPAPDADLRAAPEVFARFVAEVLTAQGFPIIMLTTGDGGSAADIDQYWPGLCAALAPLQDSLIVVPGFEVVGPGGGWTSAQLSRGLQTIKRLLPRALVGVHFQPERATGASHPLEHDDPWQGDEPGFWRSHGGDLVDVFLYQTPHGDALLTSPQWESRWIEILDRLGTGGHTWRRVPCCFFESIAYDYLRGTATEADAQRLAARAQSLAEDRGVTITFGNGTP